MNIKTLKLIGTIISGVGLIANIATGIIGNKTNAAAMAEEARKAVQEALANNN